MSIMAIRQLLTASAIYLALGPLAIVHGEGNDVTAAQVNGTWKMKDNEFKIWALGEQRLQIEFFGVYAHNSAAGPTANDGEGSGIARIEGNTAIFKPDGAEDECKITLTFADRKLVVTQTGTCGFGNHVYADGTYKRVSSKKPKFDPDSDR
jgi:hypothetical protein